MDRSQKLELFEVIIEISAGTKNKYEYDHEKNILVLDRIVSEYYPWNYGFVCNTLSEDDDDLDIIIISSNSLNSGCLIKSSRIRVLGMIKMRDEGKKDNKIVATLLSDVQLDHLKGISGKMRAEIELFFSTYKKTEGKLVEIIEWVNKENALAYISACQKKFLEKK